MMSKHLPWAADHLLARMYLSAGWDEFHQDKRLWPRYDIRCPRCDQPLAFWYCGERWYSVLCVSCDIDLKWPPMLYRQDRDFIEGGNRSFSDIYWPHYLGYLRGNLMQKLYQPLYEGFARKLAWVEAHKGEFSAYRLAGQTEQRNPRFSWTFKQWVDSYATHSSEHGGPYLPIDSPADFRCFLCGKRLNLLKQAEGTREHSVLLCEGVEQCKFSYYAGSWVLEGLIASASLERAHVLENLLYLMVQHTLEKPSWKDYDE